MVLWGGLRPIISHAVIDAITLSSFAYVAGTKPSVMSWGIFGFAAGLAVAASRTLTNRWTVIFPMGPLMILQLLRLFLSGYKVNKMRWITRILPVVSFMLIVMSAILSILFPAVELASYDSFGQFNVGVVDLYLPIDLQYTSPFEGTSHVAPTQQDHATIRILYPTLEEPMAIPYLRPHTSKVYCEENMKHSAPPPLRPFSWMIHNWRLIHLPAKHNAQPALGSSQQGEPTSLLPVVFFSHGLGGSAEMYAYQTHALAKHGYVVVVLDHSDGSAPAVARKDGQILRRNETILQHWFDGDKDFYRLLRQTMTDYRSQELLAVVDGILNLNSENLLELEAVGLDFRNKLDISDIHYVS
jgi:Platelet-activating factor acetylhydrolase, isoform II